MQLTRSVLSLASLLLAATYVQGAPGPKTSLTKRWCGFERDCPCKFNPKTGCVPKFDECQRVWFWPPACESCGDGCPELCVDSLVCNPAPSGSPY